MINTAYPYFPEEDIKGILEDIENVLKGKYLLTMGENVSSFEKEFASFIGVNYCVATNSCTSALETVLQALNIGHGDEVIVPCQTFIATASAVVSVGAKPVFAEVDENFSISFKSIKEKITPKTKAVIVVHFAGLIQENIFQIKNFLDKKGVYLIEDCAHAHGAKVRDKYAGSIGIAGCFSFYSTKVITMGEGGAITTNDEDLFKKSRSIRNRGLDENENIEIYSRLGHNYRLTELQAILGRYQLRRLNEFVKYRNKIANIYKEALKDLYLRGLIRYQHMNNETIHSFWRFVVFLKDGIDREIIKSNMLKKGIKVDSPYTPLVHLQPIFKKIYKIKEGYLPFSESLARTHICLPIHLQISEDTAIYIAEQLKEEILKQVG